MESLKLLEQNIQELLIKYQELLRQVDELQIENQRQRDELMQAYAELRDLKQDYAHLHTAHAILLEDETAAEDRAKAKQKITNIILQVDKAIEVLSQ
jgi:hypothetical protein